MAPTGERAIDPATFSEVNAQIKSLYVLTKVLREDIDQFRTAADGAQQRALIRAAFAYIEGTSFGFRSAALHLARMRNVELTIGESLMAGETTYVLTDTGQVEEKLAISTPLANLRFALALFAKVTGVPYQFPAGDSQFEQLRHAQRIRNRLAHPRTSQDLDVTAEEQALVLASVDWIAAQQCRVLMAFAYRLWSGFQRFSDEIKALPRTESGGYAVDDVETLLAREITQSDPITFAQVDEWFDRFLGNIGTVGEKR